MKLMLVCLEHFHEQSPGSWQHMHLHGEYKLYGQLQVLELLQKEPSEDIQIGNGNEQVLHMILPRLPMHPNENQAVETINKTPPLKMST